MIEQSCIQQVVKMEQQAALRFISLGSQGINDEVLRLSLRDKALEAEAEALAMNNHRQLVSSVLKLASVEQQASTTQTLLDRLQTKVSALGQKSQDTIHGCEKSKIVDTAELAADRLAELFEAPSQLRIALKAQDWHRFLSELTMWVGQAALCRGTSPSFVVPVLREVQQLHVEAIERLAEQVTTCLTQSCASVLGALRRLTDLCAQWPQFPTVSVDVQQLVDNSNAMEGLFANCWRLKFRESMRSFRNDLAAAPLDQGLACSVLSSHLNVLRDQFCAFGALAASLFPRGHLCGAVAQRALRDLDSALDSYITAVCRPLVPELNVLSETFMRQDIPAQIKCLLDIPPPSRRPLLADVSVLWISQVITALEAMGEALRAAPLAVDAGPLFSAERLISRKLAADVWEINRQFRGDLEAYFSPDHPAFFDKQTGENFIQQPESVKEEENPYLRRVAKVSLEVLPFYPLALWLNGHFALFNSFRVLGNVHSLEENFARKLLDSIRLCFATFRHFMHLLASEQPAFYTVLRSLSKALATKVLPAVLTVEAIFFNRFDRLPPKEDATAPPPAADSDRLTVFVELRNSLVRSLLMTGLDDDTSMSTATLALRALYLPPLGVNSPLQPILPSGPSPPLPSPGVSLSEPLQTSPAEAVPLDDAMVIPPPHKPPAPLANSEPDPGDSKIPPVAVFIPADPGFKPESFSPVDSKSRNAPPQIQESQRAAGLLVTSPKIEPSVIPSSATSESRVSPHESVAPPPEMSSGLQVGTAPRLQASEPLMPRRPPAETGSLLHDQGPHSSSRHARLANSSWTSHSPADPACVPHRLTPLPTSSAIRERHATDHATTCFVADVPPAPPIIADASVALEPAPKPPSPSREVSAEISTPEEAIDVWGPSN